MMDTWRCRLDNFVVGGCNELAYKATRLTMQPHFPAYYNPLLLIGETGSGKTHLLQGLYESLKTRSPLIASKVVYSTAQQFVAAYSNACREDKAEVFTKKYSECTALLMDDINDLANKKASQRQFVSIFDNLLNRGNRIILSSRCSPNKLEGTEERLISRLNAGLGVHLDKPDYQVRLSILKTFCLSSRKRADSEIIAYLARRVDTNLHDLFEAARKILISPMESRFSGSKKVSFETIDRTVKGILQKE